MLGYAQGLSGERYWFGENVLGASIPRKAGVYVLLKPDGTGGQSVLYVGETGDFHDRLVANWERHDGLRRALKLGAKTVGIHFAGVSTERLRIERDIRLGMKPPCNREPMPTPPIVGIGLRSFFSGPSSASDVRPLLSEILARR